MQNNNWHLVIITWPFCCCFVFACPLRKDFFKVISNWQGVVKHAFLCVFIVFVLGFLNNILFIRERAEGGAEEEGEG